jgi:Subtilase family
VSNRTTRARGRGRVRPVRCARAWGAAFSWGALLALVTTLGCSGGGGGGGSGSGSLSRHPRGYYETTEYFTNRGLEVIEASSAYAAAGTGDGILVGVIDTGIDRDHPEFAGVIDNDSIDIVTGGAATLGDVDGHGTAVAGVIAARRNKALSHGVAFDADLLVVRADAPGSCPGACVFDEADVASATDYAVDHGARVINYSLGGAGPLDGALGDALERAVAAGRIVVLSAGNEGDDDPIFLAIFAGTPEARGRAVAVGALDVDGDIADFSNRAGSAKTYFLVAPGVEILAPKLDGDAAVVSGTSFAAPHVTGAVALLLDAAPFLSSREVVEILLETATDLGAPGTDEVYGRGLLNLTAALGPQGPLTIPLGAAVEGDGAGLRETGLRLGGAFGPGPDLGRAIVLDDYGRPYWVDLDHRRTATKLAPDLHSWLSPADDGLAFSAPLGSRGALSLHLRESLEQKRLGASPRYADPRLEENFALSAALGEATRLTVAHGWSLQGQFGLASEERSAAPGLLTQNVFTSPYLALADGGDGVALAQGLGPEWSLRVGLGRTERDGYEAEAAGANTVLVGELVRFSADQWRLGLQFGQLEEQGRMLDASGGGALGLPDRSSTTFLGLAGRAELGARFELFGQANMGVTRPHRPAQGMLQKVSMLPSSSFGLGLARRNLAMKGDRFVLAASQPLRVEAGDAEIDRPLGRTFEGQIVRRREQIGLSPAGRELDLELGYRLSVPAAGELSLNWLTRLQPGHDAGAGPDHAVALRLRRPL